MEMSAKFNLIYNVRYQFVEIRWVIFIQKITQSIHVFNIIRWGRESKEENVKYKQVLNLITNKYQILVIKIRQKMSYTGIQPLMHL